MEQEQTNGGENVIICPYNPNDAERLCAMLVNSIDYAPEDNSNVETHMNSADLLDEYVSELKNGIHYVLKKEGDDDIRGLLSAEKRTINNDNSCWYITALHIATDNDMDDNAVEMVGLFADSIQNADALCINTYIGDKRINDFWRSKGFLPDPDRTIYSNADGETLTAYRKPR